MTRSLHRRLWSVLPSLAFLGLLVGAWTWRAALLEALDLSYLLPPQRETAEPLAVPPSETLAEPADGHDQPESSPRSESDALAETSHSLASPSGAESAPGLGQLGSGDDAPAALALGASPPGQDATEQLPQPPKALIAATGTATAPTADPTAAAAGLRPAVTTHSGLTRYSPSTTDSSSSPSLPEPLGDPAALQAFEESPDDPALRDRLIESLVADGAPDAALERAVQSYEEGGDLGDFAEFSQKSDPWRDQKAEVLLSSANMHLDAAESFLTLELWLNAGAMLHGANALLSGITQETGHSENDASADGQAESGAMPATLSAALSATLSATTPATESATPSATEPATLSAALTAAIARRDTVHAALWRPRDSIRALAQAGATVPDELSTVSQLAQARAQQQDQRVAKQQGEHSKTSRHFVVKTTLGSLVASTASDVLEAAYARAAERFAADPLLKGSPLVVRILDDASGFHTQRRWQDPEPPAWPGAFYDQAAEELKVLDPRLHGGDLASLWQLLAREAARQVLAGVAPGERSVAPWLAWALSFQFEGAQVLADGSVDLAPLPGLRRAQVSASFGGWGEHRPSVKQVVAMNNGAENMAPWAWVLLTFLNEAEGGSLWDGAVDQLLQSYREDKALSAEGEFRRHVLRAPQAAAAGLSKFSEFERAWVDWLEAWLWVERGEPSALDATVEKAAIALKQKRWDVAQRLIQRVLTVAPEHPQARQLASTWAHRRGRTDEALLAARWIAALQPGGQADVQANEPPFDDLEPLSDPPFSQPDRFAAMTTLHERLSATAAAVEASLRGPLADLARQLAAEGWPLAGLRLVDRALAATPLDRALGNLREELLQAAGGEHVVAIRRRPEAIRSVAGLHGELHLWSPEDTGLRVRCADRVQPTTLRGIVPLMPPCTVRVRVTFHPDEEGRLYDDGKRFLGLIFGADEPIDHGTWGVFISPDGRLELATQGGLEWPSTPVGRGRRRELDLSISLWGDHITLTSPGKLPIDVPRGSRPAAGWLALFGRRVDATVGEIEVTRTRRSDPRAVWFTKGGG